jgi:hypothetical protein
MRKNIRLHPYRNRDRFRALAPAFANDNGNVGERTRRVE